MFFYTDFYLSRQLVLEIIQIKDRKRHELIWVTILYKCPNFQVEKFDFIVSVH
jgi:hypothetical protein